MLLTKVYIHTHKEPNNYRNSLTFIDWKITHNAVDGAVMKSVDSQLSSVPSSATHISLYLLQ
jgi:hypothetical protein